MTPEDKLKTRSIIQFCVNLGKTPVQTMDLMKTASGKSTVARSLVYKWHKRYSEGRETICDDERSGRPVSRRRESDVELVRCVLNEDRRYTIHEICTKVDMSYGTFRRIITEELEMRRVSARWVPRLLSDQDKRRRVSESMRFLKRFAREGDSFLSKIVTADETWLYYYDPETKQQSSQWKCIDSPPPKKARCARSMGKHMFIVFFDINGPILMHAVPKGKTCYWQLLYQGNNNNNNNNNHLYLHHYNSNKIRHIFTGIEAGLSRCAPKEAATCAPGWIHTSSRQRAIACL